MLDELNPTGHFWIKLDGTDIKEALMESHRGEWNGDVDLGNDELAKLRATYDERLQVAEVQRQSLLMNLSSRYAIA